MRNLSFEEARAAMRAVMEWRPSVDYFSGVSTDSRSTRAGDLFFALEGERFDGHNFVEQALRKGAQGAVVSRAAPEKLRLPGKGLLRVKDTLAGLGDLARHYREHLSVRVAAVTGSNGKTTTKEMLKCLLEEDWPVISSEKSYNNFVGLPLTLFRVEPHHAVVILEMGTNHTGEIANLASIARPEIGIVTNISETHLEGLKNLAGVANAKAELLDALPQGGLAILNEDDPQTRKIRGRSKAPVITFGLSEKADIFATDIHQDEKFLSFRWNGKIKVRIPVLGRKNVYNALAAIAAGERLGLDPKNIPGRLENFRALPMRMERLEANGVTLINDAYNANPRSMEAALAELANLDGSKRKVFVLGDMCELGESSAAHHRRLGRLAAESGADILVAVGKESKETVKGAIEAGFERKRLRHYDSSEEAERGIEELVRKGDVVLVKGSRAMGLEVVVRRILLGRAPTHVGG